MQDSSYACGIISFQIMLWLIFMREAEKEVNEFLADINESLREVRGE